MKNILILFILAVGSFASAQIINFPDANFKNALVNSLCVDSNGDFIIDADADINNDQEIDLSEAIKVSYLKVDRKGIIKLDGIENFLNLTRISCSDNQISNLNLSSFIKMDIIDCSNNQLTFLDVSKLKTLNFLNCQYNQLTSLNMTGLTNLGALFCDNNQLTTLNVSELINLGEFSCSVNKLTSLDVNGLINLQYLDCGYNELRSLFIKSGDQLNFILFNFNPDLSYVCCDENKIAEIKNIGKNYGLKSWEVNSYCSFNPGGKYYLLNGQNNYDGDNNGCNMIDFNWNYLKYQVKKDNIVTGVYISNSKGIYNIPLESGKYTITPLVEFSDNYEITPSIFQITVPSLSDTITQDICIKPNVKLSKVNITVLPLTPPARPGFDASYKIVWENVGNQIESGTLNFTYDETLLDYISATQSPDQIADGIIKWNFTNLQPFEKREITVTLKVNRPTDTPAVNAGDKLYLTASILDNIFTLENTVVGSYDPNDKTCLQGDRVKPDMVGEYVDYLIRFENTGNYAAENVVVKDIIDTKTFDVSTLQITDASHEVYTRIEGNKVEFIFENIQLPFEDVNNDVYIAFKIKTLPTLVLGDSLKNLADIYFDYNFPIRTNEALTTIALSVFTKDITTEVDIYPNPVSDILYLETNDYWTKAEIYDVSGRIIRALSLVGDSMDVNGLESGTYILRLRNVEKVGCVKFVKL